MIQAVIGAHPKNVGLIFIKSQNKITAKAPGVIRVVAKDFKVVPIKAVQAIFGTKPKKAGCVLQAADDGVIGKTVLYLVMPK